MRVCAILISFKEVRIKIELNLCVFVWFDESFHCSVLPLIGLFSFLVLNAVTTNIFLLLFFALSIHWLCINSFCSDLWIRDSLEKMAILFESHETHQKKKNIFIAYLILCDSFFENNSHSWGGFFCSYFNRCYSPGQSANTRALGPRCVFTTKGCECVEWLSAAEQLYYLETEWL